VHTVSELPDDLNSAIQAIQAQLEFLTKLSEVAKRRAVRIVNNMNGEFDHELVMKAARSLVHLVDILADAQALRERSASAFPLVSSFPRC
jgi:Holliday junction resolvasome RuvABC DNA-binding subunit